MVKELDKAIQYMSKRRIGASITIQKNTGLEDYIETGILLDADISGELLINIFIPNTPLHDGESLFGIIGLLSLRPICHCLIATSFPKNLAPVIGRQWGSVRSRML